ncbi:MAG TPA: DUF992 domain-containing protein [Methylovirgula sp.]|nr:DUF992 domain-containing protein [Methylovirgula sp.]
MVLRASHLAFLALLASLCLSPTGRADAAQVGLLRCNVSPSVGFIVTSNRTIACRFSRHNYPPEFYVGGINTFGVALGFTGPGRLVWAVFAATPTLEPYALAGSYGGATANASFGPGLGANALVGGNGNSIGLQPVSVNAQTGLNVTAGIGSLVLQPAPR